ncbi:MAG TPA: ferric reductase-like transmembrane domain-containing protein [Acidimicrobiia bacterium]
MSVQLPWYVARASGIVAWALLAGSVLWGLAMTTKTFKRVVRRPWLLDLHRFLGGLALIFTVVHVVAIMGDTYVHFGIAEVLVPLAAKWHPVAVAYGIVGLYLLAAVEFTSLARKQIPNSLWRRVHYLSFPLYLVTTVHLLTAGTDRHNPALRLAVLAVTSAVIGLLSVRINRDLMAVSAPAAGAARPRSTPPGREPGPAGAAPRATPLTGSGHADRPPRPGGPSRSRQPPRPRAEPVPRGRR